METLYAFLILGHFIKRGFLFGPLCPIYGFGALILIYFFSNYKKNTTKLFLYSAVVFSVFEYFVAFLLEASLKIKCWDYTQHLFHLNGRITIAFSITWGIIAILFINKLHPFIRRKLDLLLNQISVVSKNMILYIIIFIFIIDNVFSLIKYIKLF